MIQSVKHNCFGNDSIVHASYFDMKVFGVRAFFIFHHVYVVRLKNFDVNVIFVINIQTLLCRKDQARNLTGFFLMLVSSRLKDITQDLCKQEQLPV